MEFDSSVLNSICITECQEAHLSIHNQFIVGSLIVGIDWLCIIVGVFPQVSHLTCLTDTKRNKTRQTFLLLTHGRIPPEAHIERSNKIPYATGTDCRNDHEDAELDGHFQKLLILLPKCKVDVSDGLCWLSCGNASNDSSAGRESQALRSRGERGKMGAKHCFS